MKGTGLFTRILVLAGILLVWFPLLLPIAWPLIDWRPGQPFNGGHMIDYVMPVELFPMDMSGAALLLLVALRARTRPKLIAGGMALSLGSLGIGISIAYATGLVHSDPQMTSIWTWIIFIPMLAGFALGLVVVGVGGILLARDIFQPGRARPVPGHGSGTGAGEG